MEEQIVTRKTKLKKKTAWSRQFISFCKSDFCINAIFQLTNYIKSYGWLVGRFILNVPVNNFSVMLRQSQRFEGITSIFKE